MRASTLENLLTLTREVFDGTLKRADLLTMKPQEKAFVGTAIMLVDLETYAYVWDSFGDTYIIVRHSYGDNLHNITQRGLFNWLETDSEDYPSYWVSNSEGLRNAGARAGLYIRNNITPPSELKQLIAELGRTPAIEQLLRDIEIGRRQERQWRREWEDHFDQEGDVLQHIKLLGSNLPPSDNFLREITALTSKLYGQRGLHDLREHLNQQLDHQ